MVFHIDHDFFLYCQFGCNKNQKYGFVMGDSIATFFRNLNFSKKKNCQNKTVATSNNYSNFIIIIQMQDAMHFQLNQLLNVTGN